MPNNRELNGARQSETHGTNVLNEDKIVSRETTVSKSGGANTDSNNYSAHNKAKTDNRKRTAAQRHEFNKQRELERIRRQGGMYSAQKVKKSDCEDNGQSPQATEQEASQAPTSPTFGELYKRFRENKLSRLESWFNAA